MLQRSATHSTRSGRRPRRAAFIGAIALIAAVSLAACSPGGGGDAGAGSSDVDADTISTLNSIFGEGGKDAGEGLEINIGMDLAITGNNAFVGQVMQRGAELAAAQIEAAGGPKFKISVADHKGGDVAAGVSGAQRLINENDIAVMLSSYGNITQALVPIVQQNNVLMFNGGGPDPTQANKDFLWLPANYYADAAVGGELAYLVKTNPGATKLALIGQTENGVNAFDNLAAPLWDQLTGGEIVAKETATVGSTDYTQLVARIKAADPDVIWTTTYGQDIGYIVKALRQAGVEAPVLGQELTEGACTIAEDSFSTYLFGGSYFSPETAINPLAQVLTATYQKAYDQVPEYYGATYYEDTFIVWELVKRVIADGGDPTDGAQLQAALKANPEFVSLIGGTDTEVGTLSMDPETHAGSRPMGVYSVSYDNGVCSPTLVADLAPLKDGADPASTVTLVG